MMEWNDADVQGPLAEADEVVRRTVVMLYGQMLFWEGLRSNDAAQQARAAFTAYAQELGVSPSGLESWCAMRFVSVGLFESGTSCVAFEDQRDADGTYHGFQVKPLRYLDRHCRW
jgi:hypothetical protein